MNLDSTCLVTVMCHYRRLARHVEPDSEPRQRPIMAYLGYPACTECAFPITVSRVQNPEKKKIFAIYCHRHYHRDQIIVILILSIDHHSLWYYHHDSFQPWTPNYPRVLQRAPGTAGPKRHNARCLTDWLHTRPVSQTMWATDRLLLETKTNMTYVVDIIGYLWWWCRQATKPSTKNKFGILPYPLCK